MYSENYIRRPEVMLLTYTQDPVKTVAAAAKLCYSNADPMTIFDGLDDAEAEKFVDMLSGFGHASPFEHANFTFVINNFSRVTLAQLTRHRIASYSIRSQRYVDNKANFKPIVPDAIFNSPTAFDIYDKALDTILDAYTDMETQLGIQYLAIAIKEYQSKSTENMEKILKIAKDFGIDTVSHAAVLTQEVALDIWNNIGIANGDENAEMLKILKNMKVKARRHAGEDCRYIFPNGANTAGIVTMNARELNNFFDLRCCNRAQWEIRDIAWKMRDEVMLVAPALFKNSGPSCLHGKCSEGAMTCGNPYKEEK